jgi:two-component system cell cycle sensor histidine kinase/response regulator CckA
MGVSMGAIERGARATDWFLSGDPWRRWGGVFVTVVLALLCELASHTPFRISTPPALFMPAIVWVGFRSGLTPSLLSAAISCMYTAHFFALPSQPVFFVAENLRQVGLWAIAMPLTALLVVVLHQRVATPAAAAEVELRQADQALRQSQKPLGLALEASGVASWDWNIQTNDLLHAVIEKSPDAVFLKDLDGRYLMINTSGARFIGKEVDQIIGRCDSDLFEAKTAAAILERDRHVTSTGKPEVFEEPINGDVTRTVLSTKSAFRDAQGKVVGLIGIGRDITEFKRLEEQFYQAQKMEAVGSLAGGIAHDFNNLLTVVTACSHMVCDNLEPDDPNRELLADIQGAGERAASLTRQLLAFSRRQVLQPQAVDVNGLLSDLHNLLVRLIGEDIELTFEPRAEVSALVDRAQFEQAIVNLVVNARDAMPAGGQLHIETDESNEGDSRAPHIPEGRYVVVTVSDSGHGMDEATLSRIFEPFFTTKPPGKGTGLGLAMAYGFVRQSGGQIAVDTEPGRGATFKLYLPLAEQSAAAGSFRAVSGASPTGTETVLLVEDEDAVRSLSRRILQAKGYTVLEARNGREGLSIARDYAGPIHLLLTDVIMPYMNGRQLVDRLAPLRPELKTLFISGYTDQSIEFEADRSFLQKPFSPSVLAQKVREVLDESRA